MWYVFIDMKGSPVLYVREKEKDTALSHIPLLKRLGVKYKIISPEGDIYK